jgi:hypothetical protein
MMVPTEGQGGEDGVSLDAQSVRSDFRCGFFTILTTFSLLVSRPKAKRELSALTLTQKASEKDQEGGARNSAAADFAKALRW